MNSEIPYTIKRLLPADLKVTYQSHYMTKLKKKRLSDFQTLYDVSNVPDDVLELPNPFGADFVCVENSEKGGIYITENICYGW